MGNLTSGTITTTNPLRTHQISWCFTEYIHSITKRLTNRLTDLQISDISTEQHCQCNYKANKSIQAWSILSISKTKGSSKKLLCPVSMRNIAIQDKRNRQTKAQGMLTYLLNSGSFSRSNRAECVVIFEGLNSEISSSILRPIRLAVKQHK